MSVIKCQLCHSTFVFRGLWMNTARVSFSQVHFAANLDVYFTHCEMVALLYLQWAWLHNREHCHIVAPGSLVRSWAPVTYCLIFFPVLHTFAWVSSVISGFLPLYKNMQIAYSELPVSVICANMCLASHSGANSSDCIPFYIGICTSIVPCLFRIWKREKKRGKRMRK